MNTSNGFQEDGPIPYTNTLHQYPTPVPYTNTLHQYPTPVPYTSTLHQIFSNLFPQKGISGVPKVESA
jgi:hypothetical protein